MGRRAWGWVRLLGGVLVLAVLVQRLGTGPFLDGLRGLGPGTFLAAIGITVGTTVCSAWRWRVVAGALGVGLSLRAATAAYYRSQFLNSALPGGVLGDIHRGVQHGVDAGDLGHGVRAVVWERTAGQGIQFVLALVVLVALPSPLHAAMPAVAIASGLVAVIFLLTGRGLLRHSSGRVTHALCTAAAEVRAALLHSTRGPAVLLASLLVVAGHLALFLIAARAAGVHGQVERLLPLALIVLLAAAIPLNVGGWGPREGAAAWVFAAAGLPAGAGAAASTAFGVMTLVATLPGAVVLVVDWLRPRQEAPRSDPFTPERPGDLVHSGAREDGAADG